jgi:hypothetical protein
MQRNKVEEEVKWIGVEEMLGKRFEQHVLKI